MEKAYPPLIKGFIDLQRQYPDFVILTEVGSFYEIWEINELGLGHAERVSEILDIVLTKRDKSKADSPKMAGFPSYAVEGYVKKLVEHGETVVVVKQEVTGKKSDQNKNVRRYVERIVSPATSIETFERSETPFFACSFEDSGNVGVALIDLSTGFVQVSEMKRENAAVYLEKKNVAELLVIGDEFVAKKKNQIFHSASNIITKQNSAGALLADIYQIPNPTSHHKTTISQLGLERWPLASLALSNLLNYLTSYNPRLLKKISYPKIDPFEKSLFLSKNSLLSLDVFPSALQPDERKTLFGVLNDCKTAMGSRLLRQYLLQPLNDLKAIKGRHDEVERMVTKKKFFPELKDVYDLSRLIRRMALKNVLPHELQALYSSLKIAKTCLPDFYNNEEIEKAIIYLEDRFDFSVLSSLKEEDIHLGFRGPLREAINQALTEWAESKDELDAETIRISKELETTKLRVLTRQESLRLTGPKGLKSKCVEKGIPYKIKAQELEILLKSWESLAFEELAQRNNLQVLSRKIYFSFQEEFFLTFSDVISELSEEIARLDVLSTFAKISFERSYKRPKLLKSQSAKAKLVNMRHPVLDGLSDSFEAFIPNSVDLGEKSILVIYGANSAGKSTILKGLGLNILMAQAGCFVAASEAEISIFESIMTRMATFDSLSEGLSTFTMEMTELEGALKRANERSLLLFDEIGRGTSVEDGEAIAYGVLDFLNSNEVSALTLFATHYHSLYSEIKDFKKLGVQHFECEMNGSELIFSRTLKAGPGNGSYGLMVAKSCGVPESIIRTSENYKRKYHPLIESRYNKKIKGSLCELCKKTEAQETHHIVEQKNGKVKEIEISSLKRSVHNEQNLVLLCGTCHRRVTTEKLELIKQKTLNGISIKVKK